MKQAILNNFFKRKSSPNQESDDSSDDGSVYLPSKSKRIYETPMSWTRVKFLEQAVNQRVTIFDVEQDLQADRNLKQIRKDSVRDAATLLFDPEAFKDDECALTYTTHKLDQEQLHGYARTATKIRSRLSERAAEMRSASPAPNQASQLLIQSESTERESSSHALPPIHHRRIPGQTKDPDQHASPYRKRRTLRQLSVQTRIRVVKLAVSRSRTYQEIADMFDIKVQAVCDLVKNFK